MNHETLHAAAISIIAEGVAIVLFLAMLFVFVAIYATWPAAAQSYLPNSGTSYTDRWASEQRQRMDRMLGPHEDYLREKQRENDLEARIRQREFDLEERIRTIERRLNSPFR